MDVPLVEDDQMLDDAEANVPKAKAALVPKEPPLCARRKAFGSSLLAQNAKQRYRVIERSPAMVEGRPCPLACPAIPGLAVQQVPSKAGGTDR